MSSRPGKLKDETKTSALHDEVNEIWFDDGAFA